jgi:hypothetical protein
MRLLYNYENTCGLLFEILSKTTEGTENHTHVKRILDVLLKTKPVQVEYDFETIRETLDFLEKEEAP